MVDCMRYTDDDVDNVGVVAGKFGCGGRRRTPHGRRFVAVLSVACLLGGGAVPFVE